MTYVLDHISTHAWVYSIGQPDYQYANAAVLITTLFQLILILCRTSYSLWLISFNYILYSNIFLEKPYQDPLNTMLTFNCVEFLGEFVSKTTEIWTGCRISLQTCNHVIPTSSGYVPFSVY